jgi:uncharacterized Ntn-hydrolase superfamily protein
MVQRLEGLSTKASKDVLISTFSIVGYDPANGDTGVAVATKYLAVGRRVPHVREGAGAIAVQAWHNFALGPQGLALLQGGRSPDEVVAALMAEDEGRGLRQLGIVDCLGRVATYTGDRCEAWAGGAVGRYCAAQGNMLVGEVTVTAMIAHFERSAGSLADRLVDALRAGEQEGGDKRGRQSAALLVVQPTAVPKGIKDKYIDLRVDSDPQPCRKLRELLDRWHQLYRVTPEDAFLLPGREPVTQMQLALHRLGRYAGPLHGEFDAATRQALWSFCVAENQKDRWREDGRIDPLLLRYLVEFADE